MSEPIGACAVKITPRMRLRWKARRAKWAVVAGWRNACERIKWLGHKPSNLERHAEHELRLAGWLDQDGLYGDMMGRAVLRMIREFSDEGHSGMSAPLAVNLFGVVAKFGVLTPLTGDDDEWQEIGEGRFQNRRSGNVFKDADGRAYDIDGRVFREPSGACFTNRDSRVYIEFPYTPKTEYVDVPASQ